MISANFNDNGDEFRRLLWFLLGGSRGGENRAKIIAALRSRPQNINQLAKLIEIDYRSVQHHITVLTKNSMIVASERRYGAIFTLHPWLEHNIAFFDEICSKMCFLRPLREENPVLVHARKKG